jgi:hypothetical protein
LDELESIQMEDEDKNVLVTRTNLVLNSGDAKAMVRRLWKAHITTEFNANQPIQIVQWNCRSLRSYDRIRCL